ncbi:hypothetical protein GOODEAATRI_009767, partial [Goodea atripinnis]
VYPWGGFEEDDPGEQYFQNLPTSSTTASPAVPPMSSTGDANLRQPLGSLGPPSPPSPSPSLHLSNTDGLDGTRTTSTSLGLVRLLQERGISAAMYHQSQGLEYSQGTGGVLFSTSIAPNRASNAEPLRPATPPNSPTRPGTSAAPTSEGFDFKSPFYDNFLASKPAHSILKEVTGIRGRQRARDCESQTDVSVAVHNLNLLDKVKRLGVAGGRAASPSPLLGPLGGLRRSGSPFGPDGMRRNRSYPAMVGASMAMKAPGPQE